MSKTTPIPKLYRHLTRAQLIERGTPAARAELARRDERNAYLASVGARSAA